MRTALSTLAVLAALGCLDAGGAQAVTISCNAVTRGQCAQYTVPTEREALGLWQTCESMGGSPAQGATCEAAPSCRQSQGDISVTTFLYDLSSDQVRQTCASIGGRYDAG